MERSKLVKGMEYAWILLFLYIVIGGFIRGLREISERKATGLAAVAGGPHMGFNQFAIVLLVVGGLVLLIMRSRTNRRQ